MHWALDQKSDLRMASGNQSLAECVFLACCETRDSCSETSRASFTDSVNPVLFFDDRACMPGAANSSCL